MAMRSSQDLRPTFMNAGAAGRDGEGGSHFFFSSFACSPSDGSQAIAATSSLILISSGSNHSDACVRVSE